MTRPLFGRAPSEKPRPIVVVNFDSYNPPHKSVSQKIRDGAPLDWYRQQANAHRDQDILDLPVGQRWLWGVLCDLSAAQPRTPDGLRIIRMTPHQLAREADMAIEDVRLALVHLWKRKRIRYTTGGARVAAGWRNDGHVRTDVRTDEQTSRADEKATTSEDDEPYADTPEGAKLRGEASFKTAMLRRGAKIA